MHCRILCVSLLLSTPVLAAAGQRPAPEHPGDAVATVDDVVITLGELARECASIRARQPRASQITLSYAWVLDRLINRTVWRSHFARERLNPTPAEVQDAIQRFETELRNSKGTAYPQWLADNRLTPEWHIELLRFKLAKQQLISKIEKGFTEKQISAEFDAHPEWYDGSRIRISQIFIDTSTLGDDPAQLAKAKEWIEKAHARLVAGGDFERAAGPLGRDRGWFVRKARRGEAVIAAAWKLKVGQFTKPVRGPKGWHILKVTAREPAYFTYFGCRERIREALVQRRLDAIVKRLKAKAKIKKFL